MQDRKEPDEKFRRWWWLGVVVTVGRVLFTVGRAVWWLIHRGPGGLTD